MKKIILVTLLFITGCGGSGGDGGAAIQGSNQTGSYRFIGVMCFDNSFNVTATAAVDAQTVTTLTINGNSATSQNISSSCSVNNTYTIVFDDTNDTVTHSNRLFTTSNQSSCSLTWGLTPVSGGTIIPSSISGTYTHNQTVSDLVGEYAVDSSGNLLFLSTLAVSGSPSDWCYLLYQLL